MSFRLVPNSVTLDDLERRNSPNSPNILLQTVAKLRCIKRCAILGPLYIHQDKNQNYCLSNSASR